MSRQRRNDIEAKQAALAEVLAAMNAEAAVLLMPAHVAWFTSGLNVPGLIADSERPGVYTDGRQRWLVCSHVDSQRFFDEELDDLGFQLREWQWEGGRSDMLALLTQGKRVVADRPFPNIPMINDRLRPLLRRLSPLEQECYLQLGRRVAHAVEATARNLSRGSTEAEVAGQLGHRLLRHGIEPAVLSVTTAERAARYRRCGFGREPITGVAVLQATGQHEGLYASCSRTVSFGRPPPEFRAAWDLAIRQAGLFRELTRPGATIGDVGRAGRRVLEQSAFEFDWRLSRPGYGTGRFPAEELRRAGTEEPLEAGYAVVWQPRVGSAAVVDTLVVTDAGPVVVTPPEEWPVIRLSVRNGPYHEIPDVLVREPS